METTAQILKVRPSGRPLINDKILVIEDSADQWFVLQKAFKQVNPRLQIVRAENTQDVATLLQDCLETQAGFPRLILLDLYLPRRHDGWQTLETIQNALPPSKEVPVVILSSSTDLEDLIDAFQQGIRSYMIKPITFPDWLECCKVLTDYLEEMD